MGTRSLTHFKENGKTIATIYRQYDGYPSGIGEDIKTALNAGNVEILNGYNRQQAPQAFNGIGCLAAYLIGYLKDKKIGNIYVYPVDSKDCGEEYTYTIYCNEGRLLFKVEENYKNSVVYDGLLLEFNGKAVEKKCSELYK